MNRFFIRRALVWSAVAGVLGVVACAAPADLDVEVGQSLQIRYDPESAGVPPPMQILEFLRTAVKAEGERSEAAGKDVQKAQFGVRKEPGAVTIEAELWGKRRLDGSLAARIKDAFPSLREAQFKEEMLKGKVQGTLIKKLGHDLFDLDVTDTTDEETARQQVLAQLKARGINGEVEVKVEGGDGERKVMIKVRKEDGEPGAEGRPTEVSEP